ncbi:DUF4184 family protein [Pontibacter diazotrophicus]|uniref:DUF4184 family protein n=1 Tax=Pontibacter diazotrophicus TaxID=1400979 RepID=A0A3D8LEU6_9BACT|nr:DUF4184 family protein [Pontibacter diazotrophicus]RDV15930.1 DUF4184 family protein [Pontibacter diazotrophicus]
MPFTFSHPAIVLPGYYLPQRWRSLTGLVAGSVAPDFEMFLKMKAQVSFSHTWHSIFWFNLPLAILLAFLFHLIVRNPLINHLPLFLRQRLSHFKDFDWIRYYRQHAWVVVVSMLVGIASHLFWDNFTHEYGLFLNWFPILATDVALGDYQIPVYFLLQIVFSIIGGLVVLYALLRPTVKSTSTLPAAQQVLWYWLLIFTATFVFTAIRFSTGIDFTYFPNVIVVIISAGLISLCLASYVFRSR